MKRKVGGCVLIFLVLMVIYGCNNREIQKEDQPQLIIGGTLYSPYFYKDVNGKYAGIDVDIATEVCNRIGYTPVFVEIDISERFECLEQRKVDCLWSCLSIDGREDVYSWAGPYLYTQRVVIVHADSEIESLKDLEGKRVAVQAGSTSEKIIENQLNSRLPELKQITSLATIGEVFTALKKGYVDAAIGHESAMLVYAEDYLDEYRFLNMSLRSEALGVAFRKGYDTELIEIINKAIYEMKEDKTLEDIVRKYDLNIQKNVYGGAAYDETKEK